MSNSSPELDHKKHRIKKSRSPSDTRRHHEKHGKHERRQRIDDDRVDRRSEQSKSRHRSRSPVNDNRRAQRDRRGDRHRDHRRVNIKVEPQSGDEQTREHYNRRREESHRKRKSGNPFLSSVEDTYKYGKNGDSGNEEEEEPKDKEKANFETTGKLAADTNTFNGVVIKYNEPSEARKPRRRWRLYPFKGNESLPVLPLHRQSAYLLGRDRLVADIPIHHPSCSKQHAVLQYRLVDYERPDGTQGRRIRPYVIDLESSNGTYVNNNKIDPRCYVELMEKDVLKFGYSSREYVLLHEESKSDDPNADDDEVVDVSEQQ